MPTHILRRIAYTLFVAYLSVAVYGSVRQVIVGCPATPPVTHGNVQR